jgi:hypothetical protein
MILLAAAIARFATYGQTFDSGSTGADGPLTYTTPGTYVFDPKKFTPPLNPAGDNVFHFTTITIAAGVTVRLPGDVLNGSVVWLAKNEVKIDGTVDLSGQNAFVASNTTQRTMTIPGAGGYAGGYPGLGSYPSGPGLGPTAGSGNCAGGFNSNQFGVPLIGGSGGAGLGNSAGGAGGGAILIASSVSVTGVGSIKANGGTPAYPLINFGGGGVIRLVAPIVTISGILNAGYFDFGGFNNCNRGVLGVVRIEAFQIGSISASGVLYTATPFGLFIQTAIPTIRVTKFGGIALPPSPTGTFTVPDVTINSSGPQTVEIQATNVPTGTVATLVMFSENGPDITVQSTPLAGSLATSTATATVTLPPGFSKGFAYASFIQ